MDRRIDKYLDDISLSLRYMSAEEAGETRDELRQHLYALVMELREGGASEDGAVTWALKKFGPANRVGYQLGKKSIAEFLTGLDKAVSIRTKLLRNLRGVIAGACFVSVSAEFIVGDHRALWPYSLALAGGAIVGVL
ncbi:MAG: hypothetical protein JWQ02_4197, partial [Capsulimonas sp.]|nr:hypothetical protein [Capsulimonas sp.]